MLRKTQNNLKSFRELSVILNTFKTTFVAIRHLVESAKFGNKSSL